MLATVAIHGALWGGWKLAAWQERPVAALPAGPLLQVRLVPPRPAIPAAPAQSPAPAPGEAALTQAPAPQRDAIHYHFPEEVDRELLLRRDPTDELAIALPHPVVLHLFVDARGRVNAVTVEDKELAPALAAQLQEAFMQLLFLPARKRGQDVAARIRIEVAAQEGPAPDQQPAGPIAPR